MINKNNLTKNITIPEWLLDNIDDIILSHEIKENCKLNNFQKKGFKHTIFRYFQNGVDIEFDKNEDYNLSEKKQIKTYLIKDKNNGLYKIGYSINPFKRAKTLQSENPNLELVKTWNKNIEKQLHLKYKDQRIRGEYFKLTEIQVRYICKHY